ncbi:MAG TPA: sulfotransferase [Luteimonas sp.]|jgi:tetratricopeptide (TPR) repeat protein|nr:sulfotransferase [Luteimonas sp.]
MTGTSVGHARAQAERAMEAGDWAAARAGYARILELEPARADAMVQLSYVESFAGRHRLANDWALRAAALAPPSDPEAMLELVRRLRTFNETAALRAYAGRLLALPRAPRAVLVEAATQSSILNDFDTAMRCAEAALRMAPDDPAARLVHGQLLAHHGRMDEAAAEFEQVLRRNPAVASGWWMLSRLRRQTAEANHVPQLQSLLRAPGLRPADAATAARALHKELDDIGDHEGAWRALELMCRARRESTRYDPRAHRALIDALVAWRPADPAADAGAGRRPGEGRVPVFIVGMHRSGTTLLEQLLDASPEVRGIGELNDFPAALRHAADHYCKGPLDLGIVERAASIDFAALGRRYMDGVEWRLRGERFFTDKQPANFLGVGFICRALPQAKILHLVRDPVETCFSNLRELYSGINEHSYDQLELADYFLQYRRLMTHWHDAFPGRILDVSYSGLTRDPEATMRGVAAHCGIAYVAGMSDPRSSGRAVSTASSVQVRDRVVRRETPKWAPYAAHLQPLIRALREGGAEVAEPAPER